MNAGVNIAVAFPGLLLALFFAVIFGVGATGAVLAIGLAGAPAFARLTQTLVAGVADRDFVAAARIAGVGRLPDPVPARAPEHRRAAGRQRHHRRRRRAARLRRPVVPRPRRPAAPATTGAGCSCDGLSSIYVNPAAALAPGVAVVIAGLAFNLFGESVAKGLGVGVVGGIPALRAVAGRGRGRRAPGRRRPRPDDLVLDVRDLEVTFPGPAGPIRPVRGVSFAVRRGEAVGVVGESGSGKSLTALAVSRLVGDPGRVDASRLELLGTDLRTADTKAQRHLLGTSLAMVFQDPMTSFNPDPPDGRAARRGRRATTRAWTARRRWPARSTGCAPCGSPTRSGGRTSTRTSSPAACASGR